MALLARCSLETARAMWHVHKMASVPEPDSDEKPSGLMHPRRDDHTFEMTA